MADDAVHWVRLAVRLGNENYPLFARSPKLDPIRADPRFVELMEQLRRRWEQRSRSGAGASSEPPAAPA
jgi:serine/threonine-protein kinase